MTIWFTSDLHIGHANVIKYCNRPFRDLDHMHEELISRHNSIVAPTDTVYDLGDFALDERLVSKYVHRFNGTRHLIVGNHDRCHPRKKRSETFKQRYLDWGFASVQLFVEVEGYLLAHLPYDNIDERYPEYKPIDTGKKLLSGHIHERRLMTHNQLNVGVDRHDYYPISLEHVNYLFKVYEP